VREKVRDENKDAFRDIAQSYPGVKETLAALRRRGYKLAQYTNSSTVYLDVVMSSLQIRDYYDYVECIQDNNLTKPQLVRKIREHFGGLTTAIVGDRVHDIEAARETGCLSIGALYGYGEKEPEAADITISQFSDLLTVFDRKRPVFEKILAEIKQRKRKEKAFVIGVNGIDCSGKTVFAGALEDYLKAKGCKTQSIHLDDFHNPREIRYSGSNQAENYFNKSFNTDLIIETLLIPIRENSRLETNLTLLNLDTDKLEIIRKYTINPNTVVIFEGVFLFRKELAPYTDYKIFLEIPLDESKRRATVRDAQASPDKYDTKYLPAQKKYLEEYPLPLVADLIIDNKEPEYPKITLSRE